jgi:hypothetical protein
VEAPINNFVREQVVVFGPIRIGNGLEPAGIRLARTASASRTTSRPSNVLQPVVSAQAELCSRFLNFCSSVPVVKQTAPSVQTAAIVVTCGRPSSRTVESQ